MHKDFWIFLVPVQPTSFPSDTKAKAAILARSRPGDEHEPRDISNQTQIDIGGILEVFWWFAYVELCTRSFNVQLCRVVG